MAADEDVYDVMFRALKHPVRRRLLRELGTSDKTFSELQRAVGVDSSHLSYHLRSLGALLTRVNGRYRLTGLGRRALEVMIKVEGGVPSGRLLRSGLPGLLALLAGVLLVTSAAVVGLVPLTLPLRARPVIQAAPVLSLGFSHPSGWHTCQASPEVPWVRGAGWNSPPCPQASLGGERGEVVVSSNLSSPPDDLKLDLRWLVDLDVPRGPAPALTCVAHVVHDYWTGAGGGRYETHFPVVEVPPGGRKILSPGKVVGVPPDVDVQAACRVEGARGPSYESAAASGSLKLEVYLWVSCWLGGGEGEATFESPSREVAEVTIEGDSLEATLREFTFEVGEVRYEGTLPEVYGDLATPLAFASVAAISLGLGLELGARLSAERPSESESPQRLAAQRAPTEDR